MTKTLWEKGSGISPTTDEELRLSEIQVLRSYKKSVVEAGIERIVSCSPVTTPVLFFNDMELVKTSEMWVI